VRRLANISQSATPEWRHLTQAKSLAFPTRPVFFVNGDFHSFLLALKARSFILDFGIASCWALKYSFLYKPIVFYLGYFEVWFIRRC